MWGEPSLPHGFFLLYAFVQRPPGDALDYVPVLSVGGGGLVSPIFAGLDSVNPALIVPFRDPLTSRPTFVAGADDPALMPHVGGFPWSLLGVQLR